MAAKPAHITIVAERFSDIDALEFRQLVEKLGRLEGLAPTRLHLFDKAKPIYDPHGTSADLFQTITEKILSTDSKQPLWVDIAVRSHGSLTSIHSELCPAFSYANFAVKWKEMTHHLTERGFKKGKLRFRLFLDFCYSGQALDLLTSETDFETFVIASTSSKSISYNYSVTDPLRRALDLIEYSESVGIELCPSCTPQEQLFLIFTHFVTFDLSLPNAQRPQLKMIGYEDVDLGPRLSELVLQILRVYRLSLNDQKNASGRNFRNSIIGILADDESLVFQKTLKGLSNLLDIEEKEAADLLTLAARYEDLDSDTALALLKKLGKSPTEGIRWEISRLILLYSDFLDETEALIWDQFQNEIRQSSPNYGLLLQMKNRVRELNGEQTEKMCEELLTHLPD